MTLNRAWPWPLWGINLAPTKLSSQTKPLTGVSALSERNEFEFLKAGTPPANEARSAINQSYHADETKLVGQLLAEA